ncbi:MAG: hypothetical protein EOL87_15065 [Spartobacteria bacterium]|nr:hypothetical protein [Spartobacteria bacterium]
MRSGSDLVGRDGNRMQRILAVCVTVVLFVASAQARDWLLDVNAAGDLLDARALPFDGAEVAHKMLEAMVTAVDPLGGLYSDQSLLDKKAMQEGVVYGDDGEWTQRPALDSTEDFPEDIVYAKVNGFYGGSGALLASWIKECSDDVKTGIILDLRGAEGSDLLAVRQVLDLFVPKDTCLFRFKDNAGRVIQEMKSHGDTRYSIPMMVLIDEETSGASEVFAAVAKNIMKSCMLIGRRSQGNPMIREAIPMDDGLSIYVATKYLQCGSVEYGTHDQVVPDIEVAATWYADVSYDLPEERVGSDEEKEDYALLKRLQGDGPLSRATDILLAIEALK